MRTNRNELRHFGIKGMKWGVRRYQNSDGTLTSAGRKRYGGVTRKSGRYQGKRIDVNAKVDNNGSKYKGTRLDTDLNRRYGAYINEDGTLTPEGSAKAKRDAALLNFEKQRKQREKNDADAKREKADTILSIGKESKNAADSIVNLYDRFAGRKNKPVDLSQMSDSDLQKAINRMNMEQNYQRLVNQQNTSKGREVVGDILAVGGGTLAVAASAITIAQGIQSLRGK